MYINKKTVPIIIILIITLMISVVGCRDNTDTGSSTNIRGTVESSNTHVKTELNTTINSNSNLSSTELESNMNSNNIEIGKRKEVKDRLLTEFKDYISKIESGESSKYNIAMASDRYRGLKNLLLTASELNFINQKYNKIKDDLKDSIVYYGYSVGGIHFIAIVSPMKKENEPFRETVNKIRNSEDEFDYLSDITNSSDGRVLYLGVDVYAEDFINNKNEIKLDKMYLSNSNGYIKSNPSPSSYFIDSLSKYKRKPNEGNVIQNKSWSTFFFDVTLIGNPQITIEYEKEKLVLLQ